MEANPCTEIFSDVQSTYNITVFFTLFCLSIRLRKFNNSFSFPITMDFLFAYFISLRFYSHIEHSNIPINLPSNLLFT